MVFRSVKVLRSKLSRLLKSMDFEWLAASAGILFIVVVFWIPFGLKNPDIADGWINANGVERNSIIKILSALFDARAVRPLVRLPWVLAFMISQDSFVGVSLMFVAAFWGKAVAFYLILRKMRLASPPLAFLISILFIFYPADQGNYLLSALSRQIAVFFYLLSVLMMLSAVRQSNPLYVIWMLLAQLISALLSEQGYPLIALTPILLLVDTISSSRRKWIITGLWYAGFLLTVINFLIAPKKYQNRLVDDGFTGDNFTLVKEIVVSNLVAYRRIFYDGWAIALNSFETAQGEAVLLALIITLIVAGVVYFLSKSKGDLNVQSETRGSASVILLVGLLVIGLGFFPYSVTRYRYYDFRVFYYSAIGGALVLGLIISLISNRFQNYGRFIKCVFWGGVVFTAAFSEFVQHGEYVKQSRLQQKILISIVEQAPYVKPGTKIALVFSSPSVSDFDLAGFDGLPFRQHFGSALSWIYNRNVRGYQCILPASSKCLSDYETAIFFMYSAGGEVVLLDEIPHEYSSEEAASKYDPYQLIHKYAPFPIRPQKAFDIKPDPYTITPQNWAFAGQTLNDRRVCNDSFTGNCSLLFYNDGIATIFSQQVNISGGANEWLELSFVGRSQKAIREATPLATVTVVYKDGTKDQYQISDKLYKKWTLYQLDLRTAGAYSSVIVELHPNSDSVFIWLDEVQLAQRAVGVVKIENHSFEK